MKNTATLATLAAGLSQVAATGFRGFHNAPKFDCPANTDNKCTEKQVPGFNWGDLPTGNFNNYGGFNWNGFKCENSFSKRDLLAPRTFQDKCISGVAHHDKGKAPSFGCDGKTIDKTSISGFQVTPEFDCDLEFHYDMPDGSVCKHRQACKKSGTTVENSQCGGAKNVTIVVPKQPAVPKETCHFGFHSITFDCGKPSTTVPPKPRPTTSKYEATPPAATATTTSSSSAAVVSSSSATSPGVPVVTKSSTASSASASASASVTVPGGPSSATSPSASVPVPSSSKATESSSAATGSSTKATGSSSVNTQSSSKATESVTVPAQPVTSTYMTTSTIFSTSTIVSCSSGVSECPGASVTTTVTVPVSTTICPVTETHSAEVPPTKSAEVPSPSGDKPSGAKPSTVETGSATVPASSGASSPAPSPSGDKPSGGKPSTIETGSATVPATSATTPAGPVETLPCPGIVPSCLNTWMFTVGCKDNSDSACYCPDANFTKNIVQCLAAHGATDEIISESIEYFKGICAPFVPENPAIVTETITYITVTPSPVPSAVYTTITAVVPGTGEAGSNGPSHSTVMTVPQVGFTTVTSGESSTEVGVVPGTYPAVPAPTPSATGAVPTRPGSGGASPYPTLITTAKPTGTGAVVPSAPAATQTAVVTAGAARAGSGLAAAAAAAAMVAFFAL